MDKISLKNFVAEALDEICSAVTEAQKNHSVIAPKNEAFVSNIRDGSSIEFDLAVEVTERCNSDTNNSSSVGGEISGKATLLSVISLKSSVSAELSDATVKTEENSHSSRNRIKFSVPVYFQYNEEKRREVDNKNDAYRKHSFNNDSGW